MIERVTSPTPGQFEELVRDALHHLYDMSYLQTHPLAQLVDSPSGTSSAFRGKLLLQALLNAIASLRPPRGTASDSHAWRTYRLLELRYIEGLRVSDALGQLALSKAQYTRDHALALKAVASLLNDRWRVALPSIPPGDGHVESRESPAQRPLNWRWPCGF